MHMKLKAGARSVKRFTQKSFATAEETVGVNTINVSTELPQNKEQRNALWIERKKCANVYTSIT